MKQSNVLLVCEYLRVNLRLFYFLKEFTTNRCKKKFKCRSNIHSYVCTPLVYVL